MKAFTHNEVADAQAVVDFYQKRLTEAEDKLDEMHRRHSKK